MIPVVWLTYHDHCHPRAMWDQQWLARLFDGDVWRPPGALRFEHHDSLDRLPTDARGAVVIIPGRFHASDDDYTRLTRELGRLHWVLAIVTSDEESLFDHRRVTHERIAWWIAQPRVDRHEPGDAFYLGAGPPDHAPATYRDQPLPEPLWRWAFSGQVTHQRRLEAAIEMRAIADGPAVFLRETDSFAAGLERPDYLDMLGAAIAAPCPSGPATQDTFRFYEALEAGCVPIVDELRNDGGRGYWDLTYGARRPFPSVEQWGELTGRLGRVLDAWPQSANRCGAWWLAWQRGAAQRLDRDVRTLTGLGPPDPTSADDAITVLVTTSPIPSHPDTAILNETLASIRERLPHAEILLGCDAVRPEQAHLADAYHEYLRAVVWKAQHHWHGVLPVIFDTHQHQAAMTAALLEQVTTPCVLFAEHDTPLTGDIPFGPIAAAVRTGQVNLVRLHHEVRILEEHQHLMVDAEPRHVEGVPLLRTVQWSQRPHVASTGYYRRVLAGYFPPGARTMIEDRMHGIVANAWWERRVVGWEEHRLAIYAPPGNRQRSLHSDGRAGEPKFAMEFGT